MSFTVNDVPFPSSSPCVSVNDHSPAQSCIEWLDGQEELDSKRATAIIAVVILLIILFYFHYFFIPSYMSIDVITAHPILQIYWLRDGQE